MFDVGASEMLMIVIVAVVVIGPKDMPMAMRTAGRWIGRMRKMSAHFRSGIDAMVREAELEEMERKWREQNEAIMRAAPQLPTAEEMQPPTGTAAIRPAADLEMDGREAAESIAVDEAKAPEPLLPSPPP